MPVYPGAFHHTTIAGRSDTLFTADAVTVIHNAGRGYPRAINNLGVHALTAAYAAGNPVVDEKAARAALTETATD
jgi:type II secretory pathway predicted ATPase ExeA